MDDNVKRTGLLAHEAARFVSTDPQFTLPVKPRLLPGLVQVELPDGLVLDGAERRQAFRGSTARHLLPRLLGLLDGTRDMEQIAAAVPSIPAAFVAEAVTLLYVAGVLDEGTNTAEADVGTDVSPDLRAYLARSVDTTRVNPNVEAAMARLAQTRVRLWGDADLAVVLEDVLVPSGIRLHHDDDLQPGDLTIAVVNGREDPVAMAELDDAHRRAGADWLRVALVGDEVQFGPFFALDAEACYRCLDGAWTATAAPYEDAHVRSRLFCGLVAMEVVHAVAQVGTVLSASGVAVLDLGTWKRTYHAVPRRPGCAGCAVTGRRAPAAAGVTQVHVYQSAVRFPPRRMQHPKDQQEHYKAENLALQRSTASFSGEAVLELPSTATTELEQLAMHTGAPAADRPVDAGALGLLLRAAFGMREQETGYRRWAPSGGNIGSPFAHVVSLNVEGLPPGVWAYHGAHDVLTRRSELDSTTRAKLASATNLELSPAVAALVVLTADVWRVWTKYHEFSYRVVHLDAGVALAQLLTLGRAVGIRARVASRWDDDLLAELLGVDRHLFPVTAALAVTGSPTSSQEE